MINLSVILDGVINQIKKATGKEKIDVKVDVKKQLVYLNGKNVDNQHFVKYLNKITPLIKAKIGQSDYDFITISTDEADNTSINILYTKNGEKLMKSL